MEEWTHKIRMGFNGYRIRSDERYRNFNEIHEAMETKILFIDWI